MKEMIYSVNTVSATILLSGMYKGHNFYIVSYGTHPCAYVDVPEDHIWYEKDYSGEPGDKIDCHGGLTYSGRLNHFLSKNETEGKWFFGWDYAHAGDYIGYEIKWGLRNEKDKKWTTEEIFEDIKYVIEQLDNAIDIDEEVEILLQGGKCMLNDNELIDELIVDSLKKHVRVNVSNKSVELYNEHGVKMVLRDLNENEYEAFKAKFQNF